MKNKIVSFLIKLITLFLTITSVIKPLGRAQRQNITHFFVERIELEVGKKLSKWLQCMMMLNGRRSTGVKKMIIMMACSSSIRLEGESQNNGCMFSNSFLNKLEKKVSTLQTRKRVFLDIATWTMRARECKVKYREIK